MYWYSIFCNVVWVVNWSQFRIFCMMLVREGFIFIQEGSGLVLFIDLLYGISFIKWVVGKVLIDYSIFYYDRSIEVFLVFYGSMNIIFVMLLCVFRVLVMYSCFCQQQFRFSNSKEYYRRRNFNDSLVDCIEIICRSFGWVV